MLLGETRDELGGSEWLAVRRGLEAGAPPSVDLAHERRLQRLLADDDRARVSCARAHDVAQRRPRGRARGVRLHGTRGRAHRLPRRAAGGIRADAQLFGESTGRVLVATGDCRCALASARGRPMFPHVGSGRPAARVS